MASKPASSKSSVVFDEETSKPESVFEVLLREGSITREQYDQLKVEAVNIGKNPEDLAFEKEVISEEQLARAKASFYNVPFLDLSRTAASPEALNKLPESVATRYKALPFEYNEEEQVLSVAMANPLDLEAVEFLQNKSGCRVIPFLTLESQVVPLIGDLYSQSLSTEVTEALKETASAETQGVRTVDIEKLGEIIREAPVAKVVATVLEFAVKSRA
jgi:hypothetical protein